jgi:hypothetical protein
MSILKRSRGLALVVGGAALLAAPLALPAAAAPAAHVACAKLSSSTAVNLAKGSGTVSSSFLSCTPKALAAGGTSKVTVPISKLTGTITSKVTWKGGKGTTTVTEKFTTQKTIGKCPAGTKYRTIVTGATKGSTGAAAKVIKKGEPISATVCTKAASSTKYVSTLLKGTKFKL